jgi:hypothetical protein
MGGSGHGESDWQFGAEPYWHWLSVVPVHWLAVPL